MKLSLITALACVFSVLSTSGAPRGVQLSVLGDSVAPPNYIALLIGANDYKHWPNLRQARQDTEEISRILRTHYGFGDIRVLHDADVTRQRVSAELRRLARESTSNDAVLIYYAGHGFYDELLKKGYWVPTDAPRTINGEDAVTEWISNDTLLGYLSVMKARHVLVVSDSCFSGTLFRGSESVLAQKDNEFYRRAIANPSRWGISSGNLETVPDNSVFALKFRQMLTYPPNQVFGASDVATIIRNDVAKIGGTEPLAGRLTVARDSSMGEFVFIRESGPSHRTTTAEDVRVKRLRQAANRGDSDAMLKLGDIYLLGVSGPVDYREALKWYRHALSKKNPSANGRMFWIADMARGLLTPDERAINWRKKAVDAGDVVFLLLGTDEAIPEHAQVQARTQIDRFFSDVENPENHYLHLMYGLVGQHLSESPAHMAKLKEVGRLALKNGMAFAQFMANEEDTDTVQKLAERGFPTAMMSLADSSTNRTDRIYWYRRAAEFGKVTAVIKLGELYAEGTGETDVSKSIEWFQKAVSFGQNHCLGLISQYYREGFGCYPVDVKQAEFWASKFEQTGDAGAMYFHALRRIRDSHAPGEASKSKLRDGLDWLVKSARAGSAAAIADLVVRLEEGNGFTKDHKLAMQWVEIALGLKSPSNLRAFSELAWYYEFRRTPPDPETALRILRKSAKWGHTSSMVRLADIYANGRLVTKNQLESYSWYERAARAGDIDAMYELALILREGRGVPSNNAAAFAWCRRAADARAEAMRELGKMYDAGTGIVRDEEEAIKWFRKAASYNDDEAAEILKRKGIK